MSKSGRRKVILHYHVFKNAGTSVDEMLKSSLGERWSEWDKEDPGARISPAEMEQFILDHPDLLAVSSHQIVPPLPSKHLDIYPIVFLRHPIDRAYSAYLFEWKKQKGGSEPIDSFGAYVQQALSQRRKSAIEDFQALHFANRGYESRRPSTELDDEALLDNSRQFLRALPLFGIVERYSESMSRMQKLWGSIFPEVSFAVFHANALQDAAQSLPQKIAKLRATMEPEIFAELTLRNQMDLRLYEYALACFDVQGETAV
jgi:hypothetical protein